MKTPILIVAAALGASALAASAWAEPQSLEPVSPVSVQWESIRLNPRLIGFDFEAAGQPPRKFRRRVVTGTLYFALWDSVASPALEHYRDEWNAHEELDPDDYTGATFRENADQSLRYRGEATSFPLTTGGTIVETPETATYASLTQAVVEAGTATRGRRRIVGEGATVALPRAEGFGKAQGEYLEELSVEDSESDALRRVALQLALPPERRAAGAVQMGTERVAYYTERKVDAPWVIQQTSLSAVFAVEEAGSCVFRVDYRAGREQRSATFDVVASQRGALKVTVDAVPGPARALSVSDAAAHYQISVNEPEVAYSLEAITLIGKRPR